MKKFSKIKNLYDMWEYFDLQKILRNDLLHLLRGNGTFARLISSDQLHGWKDSVIAVGF